MKNKSTFLISLVLVAAFVYNPLGTNLFELPKLHFISIFLSISLIAFSIHFLKKSHIEIRHNKLVWMFFGLWLLSLTLSTAFSSAPLLSAWGSYDRLQGLYSHLIYLSFFLFFLNLFKTRVQQKLFLKILVIVATIASIHGILQQFHIGIFSEEGLVMNEFVGRSFATLGHPNFLGQFLLFPIWAAVYFIFDKGIEPGGSWNPRVRIFPIAATLLLTLTLFLTQNRASILGLLAGLLFLILIIFKIKPIYKYLVSLGAITGFISFIFLYAPSLRSLTSRLFLWKDSFQLIPDNPILGSGLETYEYVFQKVASQDLVALERIYNIADRAHNEYIDILVVQGILGFLVFAGIIGSIFYLVWKKRKDLKENRILLTSFCALISILVTNFFGFSLSIHWLILVALIAILLNNLVTFQKKYIQKNLVTVFISGILIPLALFNIVHSYKVIYADQLLAKGTYLINLGAVPEGIENINQAAKLNPNQGGIYLHLADILLYLGRDSDSPELLQESDRILEYAGKYTNYSFKYYFSKGQIYTYLENYEDAEKYFQKANELAPTSIKILKEWGVMYFLSQDYEKCIGKMEAYLSFVPDIWELKLEINETDPESRYQYYAFLKHTPDFWSTFSYLARSYAEIGNTEQANYYLQFSEDQETIKAVNEIIEKTPIQ